MGRELPTVGLRVEMYAKDEWREVGRLESGDKPGSMSDNDVGEIPARREVLIFRCLGDRSVITRSVAGADACIGPNRSVVAVAEEILADLQPGQSFEKTVQTDNGFSFLVRWTHVAEAG
jgi:hypothetical protein